MPHVMLQLLQSPLQGQTGSCCSCPAAVRALRQSGSWLSAHLRKLSPLDAAMMKSTTAAAIRICMHDRNHTTVALVTGTSAAVCA